VHTITILNYVLKNNWFSHSDIDRLQQDAKQLKLTVKISHSEESKLRLNAIYRSLESITSPLLLGEG
jgi:hypothetical protein